MLLVQSPPWTETQLEDYFERAMEDALNVGLTSVHDAFASETFLEVFERSDLMSLFVSCRSQLIILLSV